jgi:hypothetical protein
MLKNSAGFCGGDQGLSWAVEPRKEEEKKKEVTSESHVDNYYKI